MSGKNRNHYVPRCLLKRFASKSENGKYFIWQLSKDSSPIEISTKDVAVSKRFYGTGNNIEDEFQIIETSFEKVLNRINNEPIEQNQYSAIRNFVYYQSIRTKAFRDTFKDLWENTLDMLSELFHPEMIKKNTEQYIDLAILEIDEKITNANYLTNEQKKVLLASQQMRSLKTIFSKIMKNPKMVNQLSCNVLKTINTLDEKSSNMTKESYNNALSRTFQSTKMVNSNFNPTYWEVVEISDVILILGDFCVLTLSGNNEYGSLLKFGKEWNKILLPISPNKLLIGHKTRSAIDISVDEFNTKTSEYSLSYFYSSQNNSHISSLVKNIGKKNLLVHNDFIQNIFSEYLN